MKVRNFSIALALVTLQATAQTFPDKAVTFVVPFPAGGGADIVMRALGVELSNRWKQPVIIENRGGAGSVIGTSYVARAAADGYTLLTTINQSMVANRFLYKNLPYDPLKSFDPVTMLVRADHIIVASSNFPAKTLREAVNIAKSKPNAVSYSSFGKGSQPHLMFSALSVREKADLLHVPYSGVSPSLVALGANDVQLSSASEVTIAPFVQSGRVRPLAVAGESRLASYPNVPTTKEEGFPYAQMSIWYAIIAPAGIPREIASKIESDVRAVLNDPDFARKQITSKGLTPVAGDPAQLRLAIESETAILLDMIKAAGITPE